MDHPHQPPAIDRTDDPRAQINPRKRSGAPILRSTRTPATVVLGNHEDGSSVEEIAEDFDIPETSIRTLLAYAAMRKPALKQ